jgi:hypothetical protein
MPSFDYLVRHSLFAKIALYVIADSTDMSTFGSLTLSDDGRHSVTWGSDDTVYSIVPKLESQDADIPGVNIVFLGPLDIAKDRLRTKRFVIPVAIHIVREIAALETPLAVSSDVWDLAWKVTDALRDGFVEIWNYHEDTAVNTGRTAQWVNLHDFSWKDESFAVEGGDIRLSMSLGVEYVERGNGSFTGVTEGSTPFTTGG